MVGRPVRRSSPVEKGDLEAVYDHEPGQHPEVPARPQARFRAQGSAAMTLREKTAWMVRWTLQGCPDRLPWDMFVTVPAQALETLRAHNPDAGSWGFTAVQDGIHYLIGYDHTGYFGSAGHDHVDTTRLGVVRAQLRVIHDWLDHWACAGRPAAIPLKQLAILPQTAFATRTRFWAKDADVIAERVDRFWKVQYHVMTGMDEVSYGNWGAARAWLIGRCRPCRFLDITPATQVYTNL